jgi:hypothetical protein
MIGTLIVITREEGGRALYSGLSAGLQRQMAFGAIRIGLYDTVKQGYINIFQGEQSCFDLVTSLNSLFPTLSCVHQCLFLMKDSASFQQTAL